MKRQILLGATEDGTIVFANVEIRERNGERIFSASFDEVRPFLATNEYLEMRAENLIDGMDKEYLFDLCERFDCKPSDLVDELVGEANCLGIESLIDISLYPESYRIGDYEDDIYFESDCCGQCDTRDRLIPIDPEFSEWLHSLWDTYHLQKLTEEEYGNVKEVIYRYLDKLEEIGESDWIEKWLMENEGLWS